MKLHHRIIIFLEPIVRLLNFIFLKKRNELRILLYHDVSPNSYHKFHDQIVNLKKTWNFISPQDFSEIMNNQKQLKGKNLLLTFDDGYISNKYVAKKILKPLGIKAVFFVISDFVEISDKEVARHYVSTNIYPSLKIENVPKSYYNMNWNDLKDLVSDGHTIGAHTKTHAKLSEVLSEKDLINEIVNSTDIIEKKLNIKLKFFAFPFGNIKSFSKKAFKVSKNKFDFIFSGIRGDNSKTTKNFVLYRDSIDPEFSNSLVSSFLEGTTDLYYSGAKKKADSWV